MRESVTARGLGQYGLRRSVYGAVLGSSLSATALAVWVVVAGDSFSPRVIPVVGAALNLALLCLLVFAWSPRRAKRDLSLESFNSDILTSLLESSTDIVFVKDTSLRMVLCNTVLAGALGKRPEETYGKTDIENGWSHEQVKGDPRAAIKGWEEDDRAALAGTTIRAAHEPIDFGAQTRYYDTVKLPLRNGNGDIVGLLGIGRDVTERTRAETELRESENRYRSLFENMLNGFALGRMLYEGDEPVDFIYEQVNSAFETQTGLRGVVGKRVTDVIPGFAESNRELLEIYGRVARTGKPEKLETYVAGLSTWFSIIVYSPRKDHFVAVFENITESRRLGQTLENERTLLLTLINSLPDLVFVKDREGRFILANRACAQFMGASDPGHLVGKTDHDFHQREYADLFRAEEIRIMEEERQFVNVEELSSSAQGGPRWLLTTKVPLRDEKGAVIGIVGSSHDITQRRLAEQKLMEQAALLEIATDAIVVRDVRGRVAFWNGGAAKIYGWSAEEAMGRDANELMFGPSAEEEPGVATLEVTKGGEWSGEQHHRARDGRQIVVEARWTQVRDAGGKFTGILTVNTDVSERKSIQSQLLRVQRLESIGTLAGGIAHDLNNVLAPILMGVEGLAVQYPDEKTRRILDIIRTAAERGASIVRQVLTFARGQEGARGEVQLKHILREIEQIALETFPRNIEIRTRAPKDLPPVIGDATQLHQVLMNLCVNARDAMPEGGTLTLAADVVRLDESYARMHIEAKAMLAVVLEVADTGTGIPQGIIDRIFDPFFTTKDPGKGTGLGLSTTLTIAKSHGGFINVYSEPGKGSSFKVYLPAAVQEASEGQEEAEEGLPMGAGELILVVDDESAVREIGAQILDSYGYRVIVAADGAEALVALVERKNEVALVITDMMMPHMDGAATIRALRRIDPRLKIIATSGLTENPQSRNPASLGVDAFIAKPYTAQALLSTLRKVLDSPPRAAPG